MSGAQRVHDPADLLEERAKVWGIDISTIQDYVNLFRNGALPHGGGGIGLEHVVMVFIWLPNIRNSAGFPHDPKRLNPFITVAQPYTTGFLATACSRCQK